MRFIEETNPYFLAFLDAGRRGRYLPFSPFVDMGGPVPASREKETKCGKNG
jgi:hypothetical protein